MEKHRGLQAVAGVVIDWREVRNDFWVNGSILGSIVFFG